MPWLLFEPDLEEPLGALVHDAGGVAEGLDIVHHGRIAEIALGDRERRAGLGFAGQAFAGRDERPFLAADIGAGAELEADVEVEALDAEDVLAEHAAGPAVGQDLLDQLAQIDVLAPQIEDAFAGADGTRRDGHALDEQVGPFGQQHAVLERAGLALVGVADDDALVGLGRRRRIATCGRW